MAMHNVTVEAPNILYIPENIFKNIQVGLFGGPIDSVSQFYSLNKAWCEEIRMPQRP